MLTATATTTASKKKNPDFLLKEITVYNKDDEKVATYKNVQIPKKPHWENYYECIDILLDQCPSLTYSVNYGVTPYHNTHPLFALEDALFPEISPLLLDASGWDFKPILKPADIKSYRKLEDIEKLLQAIYKQQERQTEILNGIMENTATNRNSDHILLDGVYYRKVDKSEESEISSTLAELNLYK